MNLEVSQGDGNAPVASSKRNGGVVLDFNTMKNSITSLISGIRSRVSMDTVRPLPMFLGISSQAFCLAPQAYTAPTKKVLDKATPQKIRSRMRLNFAFFLSNYVLLAAGVAVVVALMHPGMLVSVGIVWGLWGLHNYLISNELIIFGHNVGMLVSISHRSSALMVVTAFVIIWQCLVPAVLFVAISGIIILSHAVMRDPKQTETSGALYKSDSEDETSLAESEVLVERPMVRGDVL